jgi:hypothetical protein
LGAVAGRVIASRTPPHHGVGLGQRLGRGRWVGVVGARAVAALADQRGAPLDPIQLRRVVVADHGRPHLGGAVDRVEHGNAEPVRGAALGLLVDQARTHEHGRRLQPLGDLLGRRGLAVLLLLVRHAAALRSSVATDQPSAPAPIDRTVVTG